MSKYISINTFGAKYHARLQCTLRDISYEINAILHMYLYICIFVE